MGYPSAAFTPAEKVAQTGATVVNIHQGVDTMINPFINYPFIPQSVALLDNYTKAANALGMRVKFYYTGTITITALVITAPSLHRHTITE